MERGAGPRILIVDDEKSVVDFMGIMLRKEGYEVAVAESGQQALTILREVTCDLVIADLMMPHMSGIELLSKAKEIDSEIEFIVMTAFASVDTAIEALKKGASDYVTKPFKIDEIKIAVQRAIEHRHLTEENVDLRREICRRNSLEEFIGHSSQAQELKKTVARVAPTESTVLIYGESGTGKELIARAIHRGSLRSEGPFVTINCAALPESLLESELFGHVKGAFTGAVRDKEGLFKVASGGSFFLDEIGETTPSIQVKLLRALEEREITPVGGTKSIKVDVRLVAATNADLEQNVKIGKFRPDLFYRLNVIPLFVPPLRERKDDIELLVKHFLGKCVKKGNNGVKSITQEALDLLTQYSWPGNVRELENVIERAVVLVRGNEIKSKDLPSSIKSKCPPHLVSKEPAALPTMEIIEKAYIHWVLEEMDWQKNRAAEVLGIDPSTLYRKIEKYNLSLRSNQGAHI